MIPHVCHTASRRLSPCSVHLSTKEPLAHDFRRLCSSIGAGWGKRVSHSARACTCARIWHWASGGCFAAFSSLLTDLSRCRCKHPRAEPAHVTAWANITVSVETALCTTAHTTCMPGYGTDQRCPSSCGHADTISTPGGSHTHSTAQQATPPQPEASRARCAAGAQSWTTGCTRAGTWQAVAAGQKQKTMQRASELVAIARPVSPLRTAGAQCSKHGKPP